MPPTPSPAAYPLYLRLRERGCDHWKACGLLAKAVHENPDRFPEWAYADDNTPAPLPAINQTVLAWAGEYSWDQQFTTQYKRRRQFDPDIYKTRYIESKKSYEAAVALLEDFLEDLDSLPVDDDVRKVYLSLIEAKEINWKAYQEADALYRRQQLEQPNPRRIDQIYRELIVQYDGLGPQYEIMCKSLAEQREWLERQQSSGRSLDPKELLDISKSMQAWIKQIQQYTEATKSESISKETQEYITIVLKILEDVVGVQAPRAWQAGMQELTRRVNAAKRRQVG